MSTVNHTTSAELVKPLQYNDVEIVDKQLSIIDLTDRQNVEALVKP